MKKVLCMILALVLLLVSLVACGVEPAKKDIAAIKEQIITDLAIEGAMDIPSERLLDLYGIDAASVKTSACFITMGGAFPDEIVMVEAVDTAAAKEIVQKLETRLADVTNQAQNYDAESFALFQKCKVQSSGVYVALFISAKATEMQKLFDQ
ncbi:MAG: DUF4358 domain-containing protein [Oscillospiraceae bacterium]|nr:DUF4358 domain-containing protein [Oscillospiraceae bacterium]